MSFTSFPPFFLSFSLSLAPMGLAPIPTNRIGGSLFFPRKDEEPAFRFCFFYASPQIFL